MAQAAAKTSSKRKNKKGPGIFDLIGNIFKPILALLIASGLIQALRDILVMTSVISPQTSSYIFLHAIADAVFYFLPIYLAFSSAQAFGASPFMAAAVAAFLVYPSVTQLFQWSNAVGWNLTIFHVIPVTYAKYPSSVLPIILIVYVQSWIERGVKKIVPDILKTILFPLLTLFITAVVGLVILGPIGTWIGNMFAAAIGFVDSFVPWMVPTLIGAVAPFLVLTGSHYSLFPVATQNLAVLGFDTVMIPGMLASNMALAGMSFAIAIRSKGKTYTSYSASAGLTSLLGISQSSLYGNAMPLKKPLYASIIGGAAGGLIAGIFSVRSFAFQTPGLLALLSFYKPGETMNLIWSIVTCVVGFIAAFVMTMVLGFQEPDEKTALELTGETPDEAEAEAENHDEMKTESNPTSQQ